MSSGTLSSTRFSLKPLQVSFLFGFGFLVGLVNNCSSGVPQENKSLRSVRSTCELDTSAGWGIHPTQIFLCSSLTVAWHSCGWWTRRAWGWCWMITLLSWKCRWCWRMRTGWRTRWQVWNHDRNEILRVALYSNTVFNEMWFLTVDPLVRISVFIAKLCERQYCWRVFEDFQRQGMYPILWRKLWPLHASALLHWRVWLS